MSEIFDECEFLIASADELENYLHSGADTWRVAGSNLFPPLTPGYVLLTIKRLAGSNLAKNENDQVQKAIADIEKVRLRWISAWQKRIEQEIPQRLRLWSNYLEGLAQSRNSAHPELRWAIRWRVILALLEDQVENYNQRFGQKMSILDDRLRLITVPGKFVWEQSLELIFDRTEFWFLYLQINKIS